MKKKTRFISAGVCLGLFALLIVLLLCVSVSAAGVEGSNIGLSCINVPIKEAIGTSMVFYNVSKYVGAFGIALVAVLVYWFAVKIIRDKSLKALTLKEYGLGGLYAVTLLLYVIFSRIDINYRPIIKWDEGVPESSFPSTHAMLAVVIFGSFFIIAADYIKNEKLCKPIRAFCICLAILVIVARMLSGVHWFTDIIGGILLALGLLFIYAGLFVGE